MAEEFLLGLEAKVYFGTTGAELSAMTELTNVRDLSVKLSAGEADITTRANQGWRGTAPTLKECAVDFEMIWKPADAGFAAIKTAYLGNGTVELAILSGAKDVAGSEGPKGSFSITEFSRDEALEEAIKVSVTAKLATFDEWVVVAGT